MPISAAAAVPPEVITIFVRLCQRNANDKFTAHVHPQATVETLQRFLVSQWHITKNPLKDAPLTGHVFSFRGRILRHDTNLDIYCTNHVLMTWQASAPVLDVQASTHTLRMHKLQALLQRESRLERLQVATKRGRADDVRAITQELKALDAQANQRHTYDDTLESCRPRSIRWPSPPSAHRTVFCSLSQLERNYEKIPRDVLEPALLILDSDRSWVFQPHNTLQKASFDYKYMAFAKDFMDLLVFKEEARLVFWFQNYQALSAFLTSTVDPVTGKPYLPLTVEPNRWLTMGGQDGWEGKVRRDGRRKTTRAIPIFTPSIQRIVTNLQSKSFDVLAVKEMLAQANSTLRFGDDVIMDKFITKSTKRAASAGDDGDNASHTSTNKKVKSESISAPAVGDCTWETIGTVLYMHNIPRSTGAPSADNTLASIAAFDMDSTLISTKSGKTFPTNANDWKFWNECVPAKLRALVADGYHVVIFSNQSGLSKGRVGATELKTKIQAIAAQLNLPLRVFLMSADDHMRKPRTGAWKLLVEYFVLIFAHSMFNHSCICSSTTAVSMSMPPPAFTAAMQLGDRKVAEMARAAAVISL
ncbi:hypothetical protein DYB30_006058 [Aphanomyces astaci]|uniref:Ubiquitin-like domain-containing protein n=3 Tax=Aphanomyces astaci TaxID=112090 RepID=A0A397E4U8_APHAT|nr:hypothetical protein DYB30_006058 [Aphanomyces astaci]RHY78231.1 hypothetical protein DYB34_005718 [Aphanomyces astaci]RHZ30256.1 hypothetical protein DYB31_011791 [Aphanomyces astaci]